MFSVVYKWKWHTDADATEVDFVPLYSDDIKKVYKKDDGNMFFRHSLSGNIKVCNALFDTWNAMPLATKFFVTLYISIDNGGTWQTYQESTFYKTDCTWNYDDKIVEVQLSPVDEYSETLDGLEKEYDLIKLAPATTPITYTRRYAYQFYVRSADYYGMSVGNTYWESPCEPIEYDMQSDLVYNLWYISDQFMPVNVTSRVTIDIPSYYLTMYGWSSDVNTTYYSGNGDSNHYQRGYAGNYYSENGAYYLTARFIEGTSENKYILTIFDASTDIAICHVRKNYPAANLQWFWSSLPDAITFNLATTKDFQQGGGINFGNDATPIDITVYSTFLYMRVLTSQDNEKSFEYQQIKPSTGNYPYCWIYWNGFNPDQKTTIPGFNYNIFTILCFSSFASSATPSEYGKDSNGLYWQQPNSNAMPIARNSWYNCSLWFQFQEFNTLKTWYDDEYTLKDCYSLADAIQALLTQIAPTITFSADSTHSQFFYGSTPIKSDSWLPYITPKSNVIVADHDIPAKQAPITLKGIFDMLANLFDCYWYIDGSDLKIEHRLFFSNGGDYNQLPLNVIDVTNMKYMSNGKVADFGQSTITYDKAGMEETRQYGYGETSTAPFSGVVTMLDGYVAKGEVITTSESLFYADIDYALLEGGNLSKDGFFLFLAVNQKLPIVTRTTDGIKYTLQNGFASYYDLLPKYHTYDCACTNIDVNGDMMVAKGLYKGKRQTITIPLATDPDTTDSVRTSIGYGIIEEINITLYSRKNEILLKFDLL